MGTIEEVIRSYIAENILFSNDGYPFADDLSFLEQGVIDSMNVMEIVMFVEEQFDVHVKDEDIIPQNFDSVQSLASFIRRAQKVTA
jgi:acyl carrier protein